MRVIQKVVVPTRRVSLEDRTSALHLAKGMGTYQTQTNTPVANVIELPVQSLGRLPLTFALECWVSLEWLPRPMLLVAAWAPGMKVMLCEE